jgi:hypothetical protein
MMETHQAEGLKAFVCWRMNFAYQATKLVIGLSAFGAMLAVVAHAWGYHL